MFNWLKGVNPSACWLTVVKGAAGRRAGEGVTGGRIALNDWFARSSMHWVSRGDVISDGVMPGNLVSGKVLL